MSTPPAVPPTDPVPDSGRMLRIVGLVLIGVIVLCGLLGSCFFFITLLLPAIQPQ